jgi:glycosyltransferase involved in cell wall biosynthesis
MFSSAVILLDLSHTSHTRSKTGIQRVCRSLWRELNHRGEVQPVTWDPYGRSWRPIELWEMQTLLNRSVAMKRSATWPQLARLRGRFRRCFGIRPALEEATGLIVPELFSSSVAASLPALFASVNGPKIALFHDAIALKYPEYCAPATVARFPAYLQELARFDGVAAVSEDSKRSLLDYWAWLQLPHTPPVVAIPLGIDIHRELGERKDPDDKPLVLSVGSIEGRKNHVSLLKAAETLWASGRKFSLQLIGLAQRETGKEALGLIEELQRKGRSLLYRGPVSEKELAAAYRECRFTVYPSAIEGFGLPVLESLSYRKPCICSSNGALGESALGGGCVTLDSVDPLSLAAAMERLLLSNEEIDRLSAEAAQRHLRSWPDYTSALLSWMNELSASRLR